jgi:serine/threonine protein kinase
MPLTPGTRLGQYEVVAAIGAGGMGEVYRARDTKLGRDVAIKTLPELFAAETERIARFEREAQILASLNHPHIAAIYGLEDSPSGKFLVLELVDGESLAERLAREAPNGVPVAEALRIAAQIIDALEAAHDKGIIHRDLKPGNIMLTADGQVKVLDFGLARAMEAEGRSSVSNSPTLSLAATQAGVILGTAAYMSPEQAKGRVADKRSDVWAFGCVLYEMLTGKQAFFGEDVSDTLAAILRGEPDWSAIPADVPQNVRAIVRRCLERDRKGRIPDFAVVRYLMSEAPEAPAVAPAAARFSRTRQLAIALIGAGAGLSLAAAVWWGASRWSPPAPLQPMRFAIVPASTQSILFSPVDRTVALSPDGMWIAYVGRASAGENQLMLRRIDQLQPVAIAGTTSLRYPFFSADSRWVGYVIAGEMKKVSVTGGPPMTLSRVTGGIRGACWTRSNNIIFATNELSSGLLMVSGAGGDPRVLTKPPPGEDHYQPSLLPDDRGVLFTIHRPGSTEAGQIAVLDLETGEHRVVLRGGSHAEYVSTGHLVYAVGGTLRAVRFDPNRREIVGDPVPVEQGVLTLPASGAANYAVSSQGHLLFTPGGETGARRTLVWVHRDGREEAIKAEPRTYVYARLSPDGERVALDVRDHEQDIWILDFARNIPSRLTFDPSLDGLPVWTPDGRRIIYQSGRTGVLNLFTQAADGTGTAERLSTSPNSQSPFMVLSDGAQLLMMTVGAESGPDVALMRLGAKADPQPLVATSFNEINADLSPNGRWLAYQANDSGQPQIYVRPFPDVNSGRWQISPGGGTRPVWSRNGRELFYLEPTGTMASVAVETSDAFRYGNPVKLFATRYYTGLPWRSHDVSADAKRFLMIKDPEGEQAGGASAGMVLVLNWAEELKAKLPHK